MLPKSHKIIHTHREEEFHVRVSFENTTSSMVLYFKGSETPCSEETSLNLSKPAFPEMFGPRILFVFQNQFLNLKNKTKQKTDGLQRAKIQMPRTPGPNNLKLVLTGPRGWSWAEVH